MYTRLTPHYINLVYEATLKSFWRKESLKRFLRNCDVPENIISSWGHDETKRLFLDRLFNNLNNFTDKEVIYTKLGKSLIDQEDFPDLKGWEDTKEKITEAQNAVKFLKTYVEEQDKNIEDENSKIEARKIFNEYQQKTRKAQQDLENLSHYLNQLVSEIGTQEGGYKFQEWFYSFVEYFDITSKRPYTTDGRQIDGSITILDTTYLIELKFTSSQSAATDIDSFFKKISSKADNTMGIFVSMSGYSSVAIKEASCDKTPLILLDYSHIYHILGGQMSFSDVVQRIRRHSSQTGEAFLPVDKFNI